ncbi:sulfatase-like hydrolase/transferase [Flavilitoribacter nigricans]|uniref:Arylsulfatase n=1 Tax=Flavilitoribacter nigricans (strain ATCC 23147 / DSM 23189 / NBRC 102662 / NCIMB 1420 / SS-2) TaxID=1122177 RepID=A0A2D0NJT1_FLAN2|nr:sulfatase-like hydrolase/transferase [Flavilitoribacter nigricans]PHN08650.1 arylsulfatase [Flavilitoribacter nigricans DSM 23189 = NBRC 102662]
MKSFFSLFSFLLILSFAFESCSGSAEPVTEEEQAPPNVVIIFLDDSGWGDFEPFGNKELSTPGVSTLASEGRMFKNFYVPQAICSASRSALLTGCYPGRTKVFGAHGPNARGLERTFATMGEVFKPAGYTTAIFGKWHCGDQPDTRPPARGFDRSSGLMYSNDMWKHHPESPEHWGQYPIKYWENGEVTIEDVSKEDQKHLTQWYTERAVNFIKENKDTSFLLYVPHSMPHVPLFVSDEFEGKSGQGLYADVLLELDWSVSQINQALKDNGLEENTIVIFTSDNGPWTSYGNHSGQTPFREAKATSFDGGIRSACIIKYPPLIEAGSSSTSTFFSIDLLPSLCHLADVPLPGNEIDGMNVWDLIEGKPDAKNPHDYYAISTGSHFEGVMSGDGNWKLHLPHNYRVLVEPGMDGMAGKYKQMQIDTALYRMDGDGMETENVLDQQREIADELIRLAKAHQQRFFAPEEGADTGGH